MATRRITGDPNPAPYGWRITEDFTETDKGDAGVCGPHNITDDILAELRSGKGTAFRLYDDDGGKSYAGRIIGEFSGEEPLDDFGTGWAGCTEVKYPERPDLNVS